MPTLQPIIRFCLVALVACQFAAIASAQNDLSSEPYQVYVAVEGAYARCGPAGDYYRTDALRHGQTLEVYAETDDGWLGIRPPEKSFCWIVADAVELNDAGEEGTVIEDKTVAWIGTHLGRARKYRWQVQLAKGEPVSVIGRSEREGPDGPQLWYRIVPPSGEFRWVHRDQVVRTSEELVATVDLEAARGDQDFLSTADFRDQDDDKATGPVIRRQDERLSSSDGTAPRPSRRGNLPIEDAPSVLERDPEVIGSGLNQNWRADQRAAANTTQAGVSPPRTLTEAVKRGGLLATVEFLGGPRLTDIGGGPSAPAANTVPKDSNWVIGRSREPIVPAIASAGPSPPLPSPIQQVSAVEPSSAESWRASPGRNDASTSRGVATDQGGGLTPTAAPQLKPLTVVSAERIEAIASETRVADVDQLSVVLSRLMAGRATAAEAEPVAQAAAALARSSSDQVNAGRARMLAERVGQYQRLSRLRHGDAVVQSQSPPVIPASNEEPASPTPAATGPSSAVAQVGYLVQVYSARENSPPYALTDHSGRTVVYVTPSPGVNIRMHLNSRVKVVGQQGFLRGLNTPHILVTQASRTIE